MKNVMFRRTAVALVLATTAFCAATADAAIFTNRTAFQAALGASLTDTFDDYGSGFQVRSDAAMTAVKQQTSYSATFFSGANYIYSPNNNANYAYCAGCNGSFKLGFGNTSYGTAAGVFGAGFDIDVSTFLAFVTYGDGSTQNIALNTGFFGITSPALIQSIAIGAAGGASSAIGNAQIDNLTIGSAATGAVPEPATWAMMLLGMGAVGFAMRRRKGNVTTTVAFAA